MKTVAQVAAEAGVSVQTVYRALNKVKQNTDECLTEKINGITYFTEFGENFIAKYLTGVKQKLNTGDEPLNNVKQAESAEILYLREQNKALLDELVAERAHSREQAKELSSLADKLTELSRNNQVLLSAEQSRANHALLMNGESITPHQNKEQQPKKGFFQRFFKN